MTKSSAVAIAAGALGAALLVAFFRQSILGVTVGAMLSPLPLAMAVLGLGTAYLPVAVLGGAVTVTVLTGQFAFALVYLLVDAVPVAALARLTASGGANGPAIGRTVSLLAIAAAVLLSVTLVLMPSNPDGIEAAVRSVLDQAFAAIPTPSTMAEADFAKMRADMASVTANFLPATAAWNWLLRGIISLALGQHILRRMNLALLPTPAYRSFNIPGWYFFVVAALGAGGYLASGDASYIAINAALALCLPPFLQGLAVVHSGLAKVRYGSVWLVAFYGLALVEPIFSWLALVSLALSDHFFHIRTRYLGAN